MIYCKAVINNVVNDEEGKRLYGVLEI